MGKARIVVLAGVTALSLAGCIRIGAGYDILEDGTVDAYFTLGIREDYADPSEPYNGVPAVQDILDHFTTDTIVDNRIVVAASFSPVLK